MKRVAKSTWNGQPKGSVRPAREMKMSIDDLSVLKRTKQATENVQWLAIKSLFTGDQKRRNHRKVLFSLLFVTNKNQKIRFGFQKDR